jgi:hypothetical protein
MASEVLSHPITTDALIELFRWNLVKSAKIRPTNEPGIWEMDEKQWYKLELRNRPCTWCGEIMGDEVDPCTKDLCVSCAHPNGDS